MFVLNIIMSVLGPRQTKLIVSRVGIARGSVCVQVRYILWRLIVKDPVIIIIAIITRSLMITLDIIILWGLIFKDPVIIIIIKGSLLIIITLYMNRPLLYSGCLRRLIIFVLF